MSSSSSNSEPIGVPSHWGRLVHWVQRWLVPFATPRNVSSMLVSAVVHLGIFVLLALVIMGQSKQPSVLNLTAASPEETPFDFEPSEIVTDFQKSTIVAPLDIPTPDQSIIELSEPSLQSNQDRGEKTEAVAAVVKNGTLSPSKLLPDGGGLKGRAPENRAALTASGGGSLASEDAVGMALAWLADHQRKNGSWWFDHQESRCQGRCANPGTEGSSTGATALALLPFLGAGHTTEAGEYREVVRDGIYYLASRARYGKYGGDLREGTMYAHGISTIALCEALAMTGDPGLQHVCEKSVEYIINAQHKNGGWRYNPGQPGDTTVFGWQFLALKSAKMAGLDVPDENIRLAEQFLNRVQADQGAYYGYLGPGKEPTETAIGLLSRMYLGWPQGHPKLSQGVDYLLETKPSKSDLYFDYYATQVLHHYGGPQWVTWNEVMRDHLIATQDMTGHQKGSWYFDAEHSPVGGRLYNTALATMILEVYYRHMPLYQNRAIQKNFQVEE